MEDSVERQMSCSISWFQDWNCNERKSFGEIVIETHQNNCDLDNGISHQGGGAGWASGLLKNSAHNLRPIILQQPLIGKLTG